MKAYQLLKNPKKWTQGTFAKNKKGEVVNLKDKQAYSFCVLGAIQTCYSNWKEKDDILKLLRYHIKGLYFEVAEWNDHEKTTHEQLLKVLKELNI